jgi:hypothetical protein
MAYKYFTELLIDKNLVNLSDVFPDKQKMAQERSQVSYNLGDVVIYLQDVTNDFKNSDSKYIDLDNAIREIIVKYYKSIGIEKNPFEVQDKEISDYESNVPREAFTVEDGKIKGKGVANPAPKKEINVDDKINQFKKQLEKLQDIFDNVYDDQEKAEQVDLLKKKLSGDEILAEDGDEYSIRRIEILTDFINKNS